MKKVYKVVLMVVDHDGIGEDGIKSVIETTKYPNWCINPGVISMDSRDVEWSDEHPLNLGSQWRAEFERMFGS